MFTPTPNACGTLMFAIDSMTNVITVDGGLYARLASVLGTEGPDHTYLKIGDAPVVEYMRVQYVSSIAGQIVVDRGIDGSGPKAHAAGAYLDYILTAAAVQDIMDIGQGLEVALTVDAPLQVDTSVTNQFHLSLDPLNLTSPNGSVDIVGDWPDIELAVNPNRQGCCD